MRKLRLVAARPPLPAIACWHEAAQRHGVAAELLHAIARVESGLDPAARNRSHLVRIGSYAPSAATGAHGVSR